ncbi:viperin family antiviral radical SAM protein [Psychrobacter lutiphocae]|uniref:S-adenosylmethionine-dependent nucleotide dehydratase n=1 Tax=Psychrobacter lutiphocae (strain DSM 21542 / CCUG 56590 / IMMIB L-1110) TaxID=1123033 RepID=SAND_PSYL1|nr:viperin family antiviral radical SAM protein [Psychrobacter lutiphocae]P0DW49.1 RecName: Full=S-adenosylmethionine-dependent nucleotide dehydratase; Short=SAND; AltName: Full=Prokaryotic viperin protein pVip8; Short=pVip8 [Psychrobacter lutiphocae DSM 21542]
MHNHNKIANKELVVNWHITEACNYRCGYCFAKWGKQKGELIQDVASISQLMDAISGLPAVLNQMHAANFEGVRLNLVGGETFLNYRKIKEVVKQAKKRGLKLSAITNGSRINNDFINLIANNFASIGFSVDSVDNSTNLNIGRVEKNAVMNPEKIIHTIASIRAINPKIEIKVNTVVSDLNKSEDLSDFIGQVMPNKWKIFKVLPVVANHHLISEEQFTRFLRRHQRFGEIIYAEDNTEMVDSYIMIDPIGRFFQNSDFNNGYYYSRPILQVGIHQAFNEINFNANKFYSRYKRASLN